MRRCTTAAVVLCFAALLFYPLVGTLCFVFGLTLQMTSWTLWSVGLAALSVLCLVLLCHNSDAQPKPIRVIAVSLLPQSMINAIAIWYVAFRWITVGSMFVCIFCTLAIGTICIAPKGIKNSSFLASGLMAFPLAAVLVFSSLFSSFGLREVIQTIPSPSGAQWAEIINDDQGALGGATYVEVQGHGVNLLFCTIRPKTLRIYTGSYGEYMDLSVAWKDNACLVIEGQEYPLRR